MGSGGCPGRADLEMLIDIETGKRIDRVPYQRAFVGDRAALASWIVTIATRSIASS